MYCDLCNKNTVNKNFDRHCNSQTHLENEKRRLFCFKCKRKYSSIKSYNKHKRDCKNITINKTIDKTLEPINKNNTEIIVDKIEDVNKNINENVNMVKEDIKVVKVKVDKALNRASSIIKHLMQYLPDIPSIKKIDKDFFENELRLTYEYDDRTFTDKKDKERDFENKLEMVLIDDFKRNIFVKNISKTILNYVNYKDPLKQPVYSTDTSRCNYIIKINTKWNHDINGNKLKEFVIEPILYTIENLINKYRTEHLELKNNKNVDWLYKTYEFEQNIHNNLFIKPILKELSSYLKFTDIDLDENDDEIEEFTIYDHIDKISKRIIKI